MRLPHANRETLRIFCNHLRKVTKNCEVNLMTLSNITITFGIMMGERLSNFISRVIENKDLLPSTFVFGVKNQKAVKNSIQNPPGTLIPYPIIKCIQFIEGKNSYPDDVYFAQGRQDQIIKYVNLFNSGAQVEFDEYEDIDVVTGLIKYYLSRLPESLFTIEYFDHFNKIVLDIPLNERLPRVKELLPLLPQENLSVLSYLSIHFKKILEYHSTHKVTISSLQIAAVFSYLYKDTLPLLIENTKELELEKNLNNHNN